MYIYIYIGIHANFSHTYYKHGLNWQPLTFLLLAMRLFRVLLYTCI